MQDTQPDFICPVCHKLKPYGSRYMCQNCYQLWLKHVRRHNTEPVIYEEFRTAWEAGEAVLRAEIG